eukprot:7270751-Alexandrium_andersonii.AAC.1
MLGTDDILVAGFPCQGFSVLNFHRHRAGENYMPFDTGYGAAFMATVRTLKARNPKFAILENVT